VPPEPTRRPPPAKHPNSKRASQPPRPLPAALHQPSRQHATSGTRPARCTAAALTGREDPALSQPSFLLLLAPPPPPSLQEPRLQRGTPQLGNPLFPAAIAATGSNVASRAALSVRCPYMPDAGPTGSATRSRAMRCTQSWRSCVPGSSCWPGLFSKRGALATPPSAPGQPSQGCCFEFPRSAISAVHTRPLPCPTSGGAAAPIPPLPRPTAHLSCRQPPRPPSARPTYQHSRAPNTPPRPPHPLLPRGQAPGSPPAPTLSEPASWWRCQPGSCAVCNPVQRHRLQRCLWRAAPAAASLRYTSLTAARRQTCNIPPLHQKHAEWALRRYVRMHTQQIGEMHQEGRLGAPRQGP
jgi:hypothetical protein